jgi:hypothetical protein
MVAYIDQVTKKTTGIICDLCGKVSTKKFQYFSGKFDLVEVDCDLQKTGVKNVDIRYMDIDVCSSCMDDYKKKMVEQIAKRQNKGTWSTDTEAKK